MTVGEERRKGYNDFSLKMSSFLSKRWVCCGIENLSRVFLFEWSHLLLWVMRVYLVWMKGKNVTLKILQAECFAGWPFSRDNCEIDSLAQLFIFQHVLPTCPFRGNLYSRASCKLVAKLH